MESHKAGGTALAGLAEEATAGTTTHNTPQGFLLHRIRYQTPRCEFAFRPVGILAVASPSASSASLGGWVYVRDGRGVESRSSRDLRIIQGLTQTLRSSVYTLHYRAKPNASTPNAPPLSYASASAIPPHGTGTDAVGCREAVVTCDSRDAMGSVFARCDSTAPASPPTLDW